MKLDRRGVCVGWLIAVAVGCRGGGTQSPGVPDECLLPAGVAVVSMALDESQEGTLPATGEVGFSVTVGITRDASATDATVPVCFVVRDAALGPGKVIAAGLAALLPAETEVTRNNVFNLTCDANGDVAGRAVTSALDLDAQDDTTGERSTKIYVQHVDRVRTLLGANVGVSGEKSNRLAMECPR